MYPIDQVNAKRQANIGRLFLRGHRAFSSRATEMLHARGHDALTLAHTTLLAHIDTEGTQITTLAARAGITKQSMGQLVTELEQKGYLQREPDPHDRRALRIKFTGKGEIFLQDAYAIKLELEAEYMALLGQDRYTLLYDLLSELIDAIDGSKEDESR
jgi:DNA-binding MarR family transcriptional regulator